MDIIIHFHHTLFCRYVQGAGRKRSEYFYKLNTVLCYNHKEFRLGKGNLPMAWVTKDSQETYENNEPVREYTKSEKAGNWWHYNKWYVVAVIVLVCIVASIVKETFFRTEPDYQIAYVGKQELPVDTGEALTAALQAYCDDRNGDGQVLVQLNQYTLDLNSGTNSGEEVDAYMQMAGVTKLSADLSSTEGSYIFILEDPESFESYTSALRYLDGTVPEENATPTDWQNMVYRWTDCPVLAGLDLGTYTGYTLMDDQTGSNQDVMSNLYIGCRGIWSDSFQEAYAEDETLWQTLTAGAVSTAGQN